MLLRMVLCIFFITTNVANASIVEQFRTISWDWIIIIALIVLFLLLLFSIIRDNKNRQKELGHFFEKEKCKKNAEYKYLNEINLERINSTEKLKSTINQIKNEDEKIYSEIKRNCKIIFDTNQAEQIFLNIATESIEDKRSTFTINSLIEELQDNGAIEYKINSLPQKIVAYKSSILNTLFLLQRLQAKEHGIKQPLLTVELLANNSLKVEIPHKLKSNKSIIQVLENDIKPLYSNEDKKYYGIYLYLIKKLLNKMNGLLTVESSEKRYHISLSIPVDIVYEKQVSGSAINKRLKDSKKALIIAEEQGAYILSKQLEEYNFEPKIEIFSEMNKEIPNFMEYDTVFMDSNLFEPILTEYLKSIKPLSHFKVVALVNRKDDNYPADLIDASIPDINDPNALSQAIVTLYSDELIESDIKEIPKPKKEEKNLPKVTKSVLIADDERVNRHILEYLIKKHGLSVKGVSNGFEVLKEIENKKYDLIILDSMMPELDGYHTITKIRQDSRFNATPVIIHTSFSLNKSSMESIFQLGFDSYLPKPFNKNELNALLNRYVSTDTNSINSEPIEVESKDSKEETERSFKEFLAIYSESDRIIEKYIKEKRNLQALSLIKDLKELGVKVGAKDLNNILLSIEQDLEEEREIDNQLIYSLSTTLQELKQNIAQELKAS